VEEALYQGKEDFVTSFRDEVEVLMLRKSSNKASCFLEEAVLLLGGWGGEKGASWLLEGCGRWGWHQSWTSYIIC
jgi:hypothetical protein